MPIGVCGHAYQNKLEIPGVGFFNINTDDVKVLRGTEGSKSLSVKLGSFVSDINTVRIEYEVTLYHIEKSIYEALKAFAKNDILEYYLQSYEGSITMNYGGETETNCVIKDIKLGDYSVKTPNPINGEPDIEYLEKVQLRILAPRYRLI